MKTLCKCAACGRLRPGDEVIAFWPIADPAGRRFVCRPTLVATGGFGGPCFRAEVGPASVHAIGSPASIDELSGPRTAR